jgi:opacity protein-like surface antigen
LELGYEDLGKVSGGNDPLTAKATSTQFSVLLSYPLGNGFSVYGRLGGASTNARIDAGAAFGGNVSHTADTFMSGIGARYALSGNLDARLEYVRLPNGLVDDMVPFAEQIHTSYDTIQVGVSYRF